MMITAMQSLLSRPGNEGLQTPFDELEADVNQLARAISDKAGQAGRSALAKQLILWADRLQETSPDDVLARIKEMEALLTTSKANLDTVFNLLAREMGLGTVTLVQLLANWQAEYREKTNAAVRAIIGRAKA